MTHRHMDESHKHNIEWKNPDTKEHTLDDPIFMKCKCMWNRPMVLEVSIVQPSRRKLGIVAQEGGEGEGWQYFYLGLGPEYKGMPTL